jgi:DNA ligase-1
MVVWVENEAVLCPSPQIGNVQMSQFKPLLAATLETEDFDKIIYPVLGSPKLDGIRVLILDGIPVTRSLKPVRNKFVQSILADPDFEGLDGEILVGNPSDPMAFRATTSGVMAEEGESDFVFWVFDDVTDPHVPFEVRYEELKERVLGLNCPHIKLVEHTEIPDSEELGAFEALCLHQGYEGVMIRSLDGPYKYGRSTLKEGTLLKVKQFREDEATIIGFVERMKNCNEQTRDLLGNAERSSHKENMMPEGTLGAFRVLCDLFHDEFTVGSGLNDAERQKIWDNQAEYLGKTLKFKHMTYGGYDQPRFPIYKGIRDKEDIS